MAANALPLPFGGRCREAVLPRGIRLTPIRLPPQIKALRVGCRVFVLLWRKVARFAKGVEAVAEDFVLAPTIDLSGIHSKHDACRRPVEMKQRVGRIEIDCLLKIPERIGRVAGMSKVR